VWPAHAAGQLPRRLRVPHLPAAHNHHTTPPPRRCEAGCSCQETVIEGHHTEQHSQTFLQAVRVSQSPECTISFTVGDATHSGEHKVKIVGVIVSEEAGGKEHQTAGVVGYTHDIATRDKDGMFDARNHAL
jgi:hypothetical protein